MRRRGWSKFRQILWVWSLVLTIPVSTVFGVWLVRVADRYEQVGVRHDGQGGGAFLLAPIMKYEWLQLKRQAGLSVRSTGGERGLLAVEAWIPALGQGRLNQALPASGREYEKGRLTYPDGSIHKASLRYRGDMIYHWALQKKSWRIKTKKKRLWNGIRKLNLISPETSAILQGHLGAWLAMEMGMLSPRSDIVELRINGENRGIHTMFEQLGELFLRFNQRMPGDLYSGELLERDSVPGLPRNLFDLPGFWTKSAINNHFDDSHATPIWELCEALDLEPGVEREQALNRLVDMDSFGRFAAYRVLVQSGHMDAYHNWRLYYDPWRNHFEPIVWDPNSWGNAWAPSDEYPAFQYPVFCDLDRALTLDHRYRWAMHRAIFEVYRDGVGERLMQRFEKYAPEVLATAERDPALAFAFFALETQDVQLAQGLLKEQIQQYLEHFRGVHVSQEVQALRGSPEPQVDSSWLIPITIRGWKPAAGLSLHFESDLPRGATVRWAMRRGSTLEYPGSPVQVKGSKIHLDQPLLPGVRIVDQDRGSLFSHVVESRPLTYFLQVNLPGREKLHLAAMLTRDLGGKEWPIPVQDDHERGFADDELSMLFAAHDSEVTTWSGPKTIDGLVQVHGDLRIEPGTVLSMGPGASIIVNGRLSAIGSAADPILVQPQTKGQEPWGTLAVRTSQADGSALQHVHFKGGSGYKDDLQEYSAMFSSHDVDDLRLQDCKFERGLLVDDMVHVVYGKGLQIQGCEFDKALSDALDLDGCQGRIEDCTFRNSGNDAIDLMMSQIEVLNTTLRDSGDKGVSVGEGSHLLWSGGRIERCQIGIQVKDGSLAWIRGAIFSSNIQALNAYKKNWQYGSGGHGLVQECEFRINRSFAEADKHSSWHFTASRIPDLPEGSKHLRQVPDFGEHLSPSLRAQFEGAKLLKGVLGH